MKIRLGASDDLATVQDLNHSLFMYESDLGFYELSYDLNWAHSKAGANYFQRRLSGTDGALWVATTDSGQIVGYLAAGLTSPSYRAHKIAELENMFVVEDHRRQGAGQQLVDVFKHWATEQSAGRLRVEAFADNHPAIGFYRKNGFQDFALSLEMPAA